MSFWEVHGVVGGLFFVFFLLLLPRLTIFFSVSVWAIAAHVVAVQLGLGGFLGWTVTLILSVIGWVGWLVFPRFVIAFAATVFYASTNPIMWVESLVIAYLLFQAQRDIFKKMVAAARKKAAEKRAARAKIQEEIRRSEEILRRMQEERSNPQSNASLEELLRRIREHEAYVRAQQARARQAAGMRAQSRVWWEVLGVSKDASADAIKAAYRKIAKLTHPDTAPDKKGDPKRFAEAANAAKQALKEKNGA